MKLEELVKVIDARMLQLDCPALRLTVGADPDPSLLEAAARGTTAVMVCQFDMFETCGRLHRRLYGEGPHRS